MNIFIIANTYTCKTLLPNLDYLLNQKIENVFLLNEFHNRSDFNLKIFNFDIILSENLVKCIDESEMIIVIDDGNMNRKIINCILKLTNNTNKKLVFLKNSFDVTDPVEINTNDDTNYAKKPVILMISFGDFTQQYISEIMLNKKFCENNFNLHQDFSQNTRNLINALHDYDLLNSKIWNSYVLSPDDSSVFIKAVDAPIIDYSNESLKLCQLIEKTHPDYLIINTNARIEFDVEDFFNFFPIRYGKKIDCAIISEFVPTYFWSNDTTPLFYESKMLEDKNKPLLSVGDEFLQFYLFDDILSQISCNDDIEIL